MPHSASVQFNGYLEFSEISKSYGEVSALQKVSGHIPKNNICGFIGPDGAGKSTLLSTFVGLNKPDSGEISYASSDARQPGSIGYMPQQFSMYGDLTVQENLLFFADLYKIKGELRQQRFEELLHFSRLTDFTGRLADNLSGGMRQKLALICVLMYAPPLLILDEPTTGVDPIARSELWDMLHQLQSDGHTILISTPYMEEAVQCDQVFFLSHGNILATGSPDELQAGYAYQLYELKCENMMENLSLLQQEPWIHLVYPKGDRLHLSVAEGKGDEAKVRKNLERQIADKFSLRRIKPGMEDVYAGLEERI
ncbi:MAG: putative multidrug ABC transporter ATP-binding protein YbhF [Candidatus Marinimicrobia bacterium]|nr:putative multidrug ABC transporter ATP-binding protein YbhF [Candidatus Neomarinimicrobiota bacterium]